MSEPNNDETEVTEETPTEIRVKRKTSKDIVLADDPKIKELETRISDLQAKRQEDKGLIDSLSEYVTAAKKAPSVRMPGKTLLDELDEFMGFGAECPPAQPEK